MEVSFKAHRYLVEHLCSSIQRGLMGKTSWEDRLIGIKGSQGAGKITFLLDYAREYLGADNKGRLYINLNHFCFTECILVDSAAEFRAKGREVLLIDQVSEYSNWSRGLWHCYDNLEDSKIVFSGLSVMRLKERNPDLSGKVVSHNLREFLFCEFLNLMPRNQFSMYAFDGVVENHQEITKRICPIARPTAYFQGYLHHGSCPFFSGKRSFSESLLKTASTMLEVGVLYIKQIEQSYLPGLCKLFYLLATSASCIPDVSQLSKDIETSRATMMNYIRYLTDTRLMNVLYSVGELFSKKPFKVYMYNSNLMYPIRSMEVNAGAVHELFFYNQLLKDNKPNEGDKNAHFLVDTMYNFRIEESMKVKDNPDVYYAVGKTEIEEGNIILLWLFGFLY